MRGASDPATVTEGRQAPAESDLSLPSAVKGILTSSVSHVCHETHRNQYEVARVSRVTSCPLAMNATIRLLLRSKLRDLVAAGEMRAGTKEESSLNCWGPAGFPRPGVSQETGNGVSSQMALVWSGKEVAGAAGGKPRAPAVAVGAVGLAEGHLLKQDATAPSEGAAGYQPLACLCTGLRASQGNCNFSN